jgi:hypothetical protein
MASKRNSTPLGSRSPLDGQASFLDTPSPAGPADDNDKAAHAGQASPAPVPQDGPTLQTRINPEDLLCDWDQEALTAEDEGLAAKWGKPPADNFVRAHPTWSGGCYLLDCTSSHGMEAEYIVARAVAHRLEEEDEPAKAIEVYLLADRDGGFIFWAIKLGDLTRQKPSDFLRSAKRAIVEARQKWVKIRWNDRRGVKGYRTRPARIEILDPVWPDDPQALFLETVANRYISDPTDQIIRRYLGEE